MYSDLDPAGNEANIAFFLQIAPSNIVLVPRLLSRIWHPKNVYCLHIDRKVPDYVTNKLLDAVKDNPKLSNVYFMSSSQVTYGGVSTLLNTLDSMHSLLISSKTWDYYINLSGSDYPLVSSTAIRRLLGLRQVMEKRVNFVHFSHNMSSWGRLASHRLGTLHFDPSLGFDEEKTSNLMETRFRHPVVATNNVRLVVAKGESWIIAHRTFCEYASHGNMARRILALFSNMQSSSEHFFQTLGWNHHRLNRTIARHSFREVVWNFKGVQAAQHPFSVDERDKDGTWLFWPKLSQSPNFFARKFEVPSSQLMDHIDVMRSGATGRPVNVTALTQSFEIVKSRFHCVANLPQRLKEREISSCFATGWRGIDCENGDMKLCIGAFPGPPAT